MFRTDDRQSICDVLLPPDGYRTDSVLATTYSLDFTALTAVISNLAQFGPPQDRDEEESANNVAAILGLKRRAVVFVNHGFVHPGQVRRANRLFTLYDRFIVPVKTAGLAFHPKIWLIKYTPTGRPGGQPRYRLVCSSRNVTTANTWECGVVLEGVRQRPTGTIGPEVALFLRALIRRSAHAGSLARMLASEVANVRFESPDQAFSVRFLGQWPGGQSLWPEIVAKDPADAVFVAPFVTAPFLQRLRGQYGERLRVVGVQEELDKLLAGAGADTTALREWLSREGNAFVVLPETPEGQRLDLHAKLLLTRRGKRGRSVIVSANGTASAWGFRSTPSGQNWEAALRLDGRELLTDFERNFMYENVRSRQLRPWIEPYQPRKLTIEQQCRNELDDAQRCFGRLGMKVRWWEPRRELVLRCPTPPDEAVYEVSRIRAQVAPLGLDDVEGSLQDLQPLLGGRSLSFGSAGPESLGEFVFVRLEHLERRSVRKEFLLMAQVEGPQSWRDRRDQAVLRQIVGQDGLVALLLSILTGRPPESSRSAKGGNGGATPGRHGAGAIESMLEPLLRSWALNRDQYDDVCAAFEGLEAPPTIRSLIERLRAADGRAQRKRLRG
jgi:hypothetical protein